MITPIQIQPHINEYLESCVSGDELIKWIDDAVSNDDVYEYDEDLKDVIMRYQDILALYVDNSIKRSENSAFYGPERLRVVVCDLKQELDTFDLSGKGAQARY